MLAFQFLSVGDGGEKKSDEKKKDDKTNDRKSKDKDCG